jgi:hypothetical protein
VVNVLAAAWLLFEVVNIAWPRDIGATWYVEWGCLLMFALIAIGGVVTHRLVLGGRESTATVPASVGVPGD